MSPFFGGTLLSGQTFLSFGRTRHVRIVHCDADADVDVLVGVDLTNDNGGGLVPWMRVRECVHVLGLPFVILVFITLLHLINL